MIAVHITAKGLTVDGHAGYAETGKDIVCAAVSALLQSMIKSICNLTDDTISYELAPGRAEIEFEDLSKSGKLLIDSFFIGICMISSEYPECIRIG